jgi:hypothetical protein
MYLIKSYHCNLTILYSLDLFYFYFVLFFFIIYIYTSKNVMSYTENHRHRISDSNSKANKYNKNHFSRKSYDKITHDDSSAFKKDMWSNQHHHHHHNNTITNDGIMRPLRSLTRGTVCYTMAFVCWWFVLSAFLASVGYSIQTFVTSLQTRKSQVEMARNWLRMVCFNDTMVVSLGSSVDCAKNQRDAEMSPAMWAMFDVMTTWNVCGSYGCERILEQGVTHFQRLGFLFLAIMIFLLLFTRKKMIKMYEARENIDLGSTYYARRNDISTTATATPTELVIDKNSCNSNNILLHPSVADVDIPLSLESSEEITDYDYDSDDKAIV